MYVLRRKKKKRNPNVPRVAACDGVSDNRMSMASKERVRWRSAVESLDGFLVDEQGVKKSTQSCGVRDKSLCYKTMAGCKAG